MANHIGVFSLKGGVGKTSIGLNLAMTLDYALITNEIHSPVEDIMADGDFIKVGPGVPFPKGFDDVDIIYDFGGYVDTRTIEVIKGLDIIIIPIQESHINMQVGVNSINEIIQYNKNIVVIANKTEKGSLKKIEAKVHEFFDVPVLELKTSKFFDNIFKERRSLRAVVADGGLKRYNYGKVSEQFDKIIEHIGV